MQTAVRESLGIELTGQAHRALTDCRALAAILPRVMQHLGLDTIADCALGKSMGPWVERSGRLHGPAVGVACLLACSSLPGAEHVSISANCFRRRAAVLLSSRQP